jgi:hypothetical protein
MFLYIIFDDLVKSYPATNRTLRGKLRSKEHLRMRCREEVAAQSGPSGTEGLFARP